VTLHVPALVVGGGISGLVCAYALRKAGIEAQLVEAASCPGGMIRSERREGFLLELGPQSFSGTAQLRSLFADLGIADQLLEAPPRAPRYILMNGKLRSVPMNPAALFLSSLIDGSARWALARDIFGKSVPPEGDESVAAFMRRKFSERLLDRFVGPFVSGVHAGDPERLSLRSAFPQLYEAEKATGSAIRGLMRAAKAAKAKEVLRERPTLLSFRNGNEALIQGLAAKLGASLRCGVFASAIRRKGAGEASYYEVKLNSDRNQEVVADNLVLATPTEVTASLLGEVSTGLAEILGGIDYAPVAVVSTGYRRQHIARPLNGFGFLIPRSAGLRTLGTVWNSSLFPGRTPEGMVLFTSFVGGATDPQAVMLAPNELISIVHREIVPLMRIQQQPVFSQVTLYSRALPQYNLGHSERLAALAKLRKQFPGLYLAGNYFIGPSIGACVEQALAVAEEIRSRVLARAPN
jgi:protoporphyrinogen/coproporphyrinogen III oxidase